VAGLVWRVEDLVVEDGKVKGKAETDGVGRSKVSLCNLGGSLVSLKGGIGGSLAAVTNGELGQVTVVVTLPVYLLENVINAPRWIGLTSCGRKPWIHRFERKESSACPKLRGCLRRSWPTRSRSSDGTP
jgi:hypothetical protein